MNKGSERKTKYSELVFKSRRVQMDMNLEMVALLIGPTCGTKSKATDSNN